jgi:hypothetical protein
MSDQEAAATTPDNEFYTFEKLNITNQDDLHSGTEVEVKDNEGHTFRGKFSSNAFGGKNGRLVFRINVMDGTTKEFYGDVDTIKLRIINPSKPINYYERGGRKTRRRRHKKSHRCHKKSHRCHKKSHRRHKKSHRR